jgi:hypothetical protein
MRRTAALAALAVAGSLFATAAPAQACIGLPCDVVNIVCEVATGRVCVR